MNELTFEVWIETGATNGLYTLHRILQGRPEHPMVNPYTYVRNLGRTWETACANADKYCDSHPHIKYVKFYDISDECGTLRKRGEYDDNRLWFGKHQGKLIEDLVETEKDYLIYIRDNFTSDNPRINSLINGLKAMELGESKYEKQKREREERKEVEDAERAVKMADAPIIEEGRRSFVVTIIGTKWQASDYGDTLKMLAEDEDGNRYWGSVPRAVSDYKADNEVEYSGLKFELTARVTRSDDDEHFGFFSRPYAKLEECLIAS